ncbi:MBL fold metallo-hydrolase [Paenibacillus donghaensis]|uniref:MBL fold metallo-hydrolase n=1 Tax=Paenibacillus donghaensis TaxID=414771 RepID=A0A2Z2KKL8_9BACL|nr:MBL fold metallo-hydrolase [Paenibacillus donghaensis]ASA24785.1 MBL fold metallo-hydrolase [Paenibacillus donghaensis]
MILADGVAMISLRLGGFVLNPVVLWDEKTALLVDTGMPGQVQAIIEALRELGVPLERLHTVILTHQDIDHIGSLPELQESVGHQITVCAHEQDQPYIEGEQPLLKLELPPEMQHFIKHPPRAKVDRLVTDGEYLPWFGGIRILFTPGHTPGHISLYLQQSKILITGDAMYCENNRLYAPSSRTTPDMPAALLSIRKFQEYDITQAVCYHGGVCSNRVNEQIRLMGTEMNPD